MNWPPTFDYTTLTLHRHLLVIRSDGSVRCQGCGYVTHPPNSVDVQHPTKFVILDSLVPREEV
jgi:hypothetical protein